MHISLIIKLIMHLIYAIESIQILHGAFQACHLHIRKKEKTYGSIAVWLKDQPYDEDEYYHIGGA